MSDFKYSPRTNEWMDMVFTEQNEIEEWLTDFLEFQFGEVHITTPDTDPGGLEFYVVEDEVTLFLEVSVNLDEIKFGTVYKEDEHHGEVLTINDWTEDEEDAESLIASLDRAIRDYTMLSIGINSTSGYWSGQ